MELSRQNDKKFIAFYEHNERFKGFRKKDVFNSNTRQRSVTNPQSLNCNHTKKIKKFSHGDLSVMNKPQGRINTHLTFIC